MNKIKPLVFCALFATLMALGAFIKIPGPLLPITLQTFFAVLAGLLLGPKYGFLAMLIYMLVGLLGVPVFTAGGGIGYVLRPSFGYIIGFCVCAFIAGLAPRMASTMRAVLPAAFGGLCALYAAGLTYYAVLCRFVLALPLSARELFLYGFLLPLPGDVICTFLGVRVAGRLRHAIRLPFFEKKKS